MTIIPFSYEHTIRKFEFEGNKYFWSHGKRWHNEYGPAIQWNDGTYGWYINYEPLFPEKVIDDPEIKRKYPKLIESMVIYITYEYLQDF